MKGISRSSTKRNEGFYRYLKPGALAQLRDFKINARSQKSTTLLTRSPQDPGDTPFLQDQTQIQSQMSMFDDIPDFFNKICGPYCMQRKKLMAAKSVPFLNLNPSSPVLESSVGNSNNSLMNVLSNDLLVAH